MVIGKLLCFCVLVINNSSVSVVKGKQQTTAQKSLPITREAISTLSHGLTIRWKINVNTVVRTYLGLELLIERINYFWFFGSLYYHFFLITRSSILLHRELLFESQEFSDDSSFYHYRKTTRVVTS